MVTSPQEPRCIPRGIFCHQPPRRREGTGSAGRPCCSPVRNTNTIDYNVSFRGSSSYRHCRPSSLDNSSNEYSKYLLMYLKLLIFLKVAVCPLAPHTYIQGVEQASIERAALLDARGFLLLRSARSIDDCSPPFPTSQKETPHGPTSATKALN